jgi:uncharacterized membrane protein
MERPRLTLQPSKLDISLDVISLMALLFIWIYTIVQYANLPAIIPTHFDINGKIDDYGSKAVIFILPSIITVVLIGLSLLNKYPHIFNYTTKITKDIAQQQYTIATRLLRIIKMVIVLFTSVLMVDIINATKTGYSLLHWWVILIFMMAMILPIVFSSKLVKK